MSTSDVRYPAASGNPNVGQAPVITPYSAPLPGPPRDGPAGRQARCATGIRFITTIPGILNIIIIIAIVCVLISAGVTSASSTRAADDIGPVPKAKVSAFHTRNAVLFFAAFGLFFILVDTILHVTSLINRLPSAFDQAFIILMLVLAGIYLIIGCCAAAWEQKMRDTLGVRNQLPRKGAAASAAFFLFVAMIFIIINFVSRLIRPPPSQDYNP